MVGVLYHRDNSVRIKALTILENLSDYTCLPSVVALDNSDGLAEFETFPDLKASYFDLEWFGLFSHESDKPIRELCDEPLAVLELSFNHFHSVTNFNLELRIVTYSFEESLVIEEVPLILIIVLKLKACLSKGINLEGLHFLQRWTHILREKLVGSKLLVKEAVAEQHASPSIDILSQLLVVLTLAFFLHPQRIEQKLRHSDEL